MVQEESCSKFPSDRLFVLENIHRNKLPEIKRTKNYATLSYLSSIKANLHYCKTDISKQQNYYTTNYYGSSRHSFHNFETRSFLEGVPSQTTLCQLCPPMLAILHKSAALQKGNIDILD